MSHIFLYLKYIQNHNYIANFETSLFRINLISFLFFCIGDVIHFDIYIILKPDTKLWKR